MDSLIKRYPLLAFFVLAYVITWLAVIPFALGAFPVPMFPFGPLVAAIIVATVCGGWLGTRSLLLRMVQWRAAPHWYAFALLLPAAVALGAAYISVVVFGAADPTSSILAALPGLIPAFVLMMLNPLQGSMGEEPGWRGFALPRLLANRAPLVTSLVLGVLVAGWHAPLFVAGLYANAWTHILFIVSTTVLYTLLYTGTGGSVLLAMVFHTGWNLMPEIVLFSSFSGAQLQQAFTLYTLGGIAVSILVTILAWRRLTRFQPLPPITPAPAPVPA
jgi:uncharacterized protein